MTTHSSIVGLLSDWKMTGVERLKAEQEAEQNGFAAQAAALTAITSGRRRRAQAVEKAKPKPISNLLQELRAKKAEENTAHLVRHCLCLVFSRAFVAWTVPLLCISAACMAQTVLVSCGGVGPEALL